MRSDSPATLNYNIDNFSVITYDPKNTNTSTVIDTSNWVEDVKDALFESGTWPVCYGPTNSIISNPFFESVVASLKVAAALPETLKLQLVL